MATTMPQITEIPSLSPGELKAKSGLQVSRYFTRAGVNPYDEIEWENRSASITNEKGKVVFEQNNVEIP
ncbi:MAG TPA: hypothetical protein VMR88_10820, partial [Candidatus Polarisedimenticolaceae bacterium]|nr:hypothetical protein [Candidatus Polarisedimenticolaceae bacterium]